MSVQTIIGRARRRVRLAHFVVLAAAVVFASCSDLLFSPNAATRGIVALQPYFSFNGFESADINVIRITAKELPAGTVVLDSVFTVDPTQNTWNLPIELKPGVDYEITIQLINRVNGLDNVISSGVIPKLSVTPGTNPSPAPVETFPGPPENIGVKSVTISPRDQSLLEGDQTTLGVAIDGPSGAVVLWTSSNNNVATIGTDGKLTAKAPGTAVITAIAGPKQDAINVTVGAKATQVEITPGTKTLVSFGEDATFTTRVLDTRNGALTSISAACSIADATIATQISPCVFRARKNGTTTITATATQAGRTLTGTSQLIVSQKAVSVTVTPSDAGTFDAIGGTQQFTAAAKDANNNDVTGISFTWSSSDNNVATVDANGLATTKGNGSANITASMTGATASGKLTVAQKPATLEITPGDATLKSINETATYKAVVKDSRGNVMNLPVIWQSTMPLIASVDGNGVVTANGDGVAVITAVAGTLRQSVQVSVERVAKTIRISPADPQTIQAGKTKQYGAQILDANGFAMPSQAVTWRSSATNVATISQTGLASGASAGTTQISATGSGLTGAVQLTVTGAPVGIPFTSGNVLVVSNRSDQNQTFINKMTPLMTGITFASATSAAPLTPTYLAQFKVVVLWEDGIFSGATAIGNAIGQYVQNGGNVVLGTFFWQDKKDNPTYGFGNAGWGTLEAFDPFKGFGAGVNNSTHGSLYEYRSATLDPASIVVHPLTAGVTALTVSYYPNGEPADPAATVVAKYMNGAPLIAFRTFTLGQRVVAVSFDPVHEIFGGISGDYNRILTNAITWAGGGGTPTVPASSTFLNSIVAPRSIYAPTDAFSGVGGTSGKRTFQGKTTKAGEDK